MAELPVHPPPPSQSIIWVNTSTTITSYEFSATRPSTPKDGMVWFVTGTDAPGAFNAIKTNGLWIYPTMCYQYIDGDFQAITAETWDGSAWKEWRTWFYKPGIPYISFTLYANSQTTVLGTSSNPVANASGGTGFDANGIHLKGVWGQYGEKALTSDEQVDFTNFKTLYFDVESIVGDQAGFGISTTSIRYTTSLFRSKKMLLKQRALLEIDVSDLTSSYYIGCNHGNTDATYTIYNIYAE